MPQVANEVMRKLSDPNATAKEIHRIISDDQALAAKVLKVANSSFYGNPRNVTRLSDAVMLMGFNSLRSLVMASVMKDLFTKFGLPEKLLWEHSRGCAAAAKRIAAATKFSKVEESFLAGLMHDIGKVILNIKCPDRMMEILQEVYNSDEESFEAVERRELGFDHAEVGRLIAAKWRFSEEIEEAIGLHHHPGRANIMPRLTVIIHLADAFCHKLEIGPTRRPHLNLSEVQSAKALGLGEKALDQLLEEIAEAIKADD